MNMIKKCKTLAAIVVLIVTYLATPAVYAADFPAPGDLADGAQTWANTCTRCHNLRAPNELRDDQWITSIFHMRIRAGLTGKETRDVLTFLQAANATAAQERTRTEANVQKIESDKK